MPTRPDGGGWDTGLLAKGESASVTFNQPGTYTYHLHAASLDDRADHRHGAERGLCPGNGGGNGGAEAICSGIAGPAPDGSRRALKGLCGYDGCNAEPRFVVPAQAGTHTPCRGDVARSCKLSSSCGYGSPPARGRRLCSPQPSEHSPHHCHFTRRLQRHGGRPYPRGDAADGNARLGARRHQDAWPRQEGRAADRHDRARRRPRPARSRSKAAPPI